MVWRRARGGTTVLNFLRTSFRSRFVQVASAVVGSFVWLHVIQSPDLRALLGER